MKTRMSPQSYWPPDKGLCGYDSSAQRSRSPYHPLPPVHWSC